VTSCGSGGHSTTCCNPHARLRVAHLSQNAGGPLRSASAVA
jgi:hypothetical protein